MKPFIRAIFAVAAVLIYLSCSKTSDPKPDIREMTDLQKQISGKWYFDWAGYISGTPDDYFDFTDQIIDSLSSDTVVYRVLNTHVVSNGFCNDANGRWTLRADSTMSMSCMGNVKLFRLTDSVLALGVPTGYSYFPWAVYNWKRFY